MDSELHALLNHGRRLVPGVLLTALVVGAFSNSLAVPFLLDDVSTIPGNPTLRSLSPIAGVIFPPPEMYTAGRPLLNLSFALNYAIGGTAVGGYHVINLAIHLAAAFTVFGLVRRILVLPAFGDRAPGTTRAEALVVAAVWALHPLQTAPVTYISQRAESLMGLFFLLTLYCFLRGVQAGKWRWLVAATVACLAGMLTKEVMITAPLVVFLVDWQSVAGTLRGAWERRWRFYLGLASTWLALAALMINSSLGKRAVGLGQGVGWFDYARIECFAVVHYLRLAIWPDGLVFDYGTNLPPPGVGQLLGCGAILTALIALAVVGLIRRQAWALPLAVFFVLLAPSSSIVPVAGQPIAENRVYLPLLAIVAAIAVATGRVLPRRGPWLLGAGTIALGALAHARNHDFRSEVSIWADTLDKRPNNPRAVVYLSEAHRVAGNPNAAVDVLLTALRRKPDSAELHNNLATTLVASGRTEEAVKYLEAAIRLKPDLAIAHENLGALRYASGNIGPALASLRTAIALNPKSAGGHNYAGLCLLKLGDIAGAAAEFETTLRLDPNYTAARTNLELARNHLRQANR